MFILCTYIDGPRWQSAFEPLLYPTGMSFYRPFSYKREYFHPVQVADQLTDPSQRRSLLETTWNEGFFGLRFRDPAYPEFLPLFIPLRKVTMLHVEASDQINASFKLGPYVSPILTTVDEKEYILPHLELGSILTDLGETTLLIVLPDSHKGITSNWNLNSNFPPGMWEALERSVSPAARANIYSTLLLRLVRLRQRGKAEPLTLSEIDSTSHIWGFRLQENRAYDVLLTYFRLKQKPDTEAPPIEHHYCLSNPPEEVLAARRVIQINANYRNEELWISPKTAGAGPIQLAFEPCQIGDMKIADQKVSKTIGLKFPVLVEPEHWPQKRIVDLVIFLLCLVLCGVVVKYAGWSKISQSVSLVLIAALVSVALNSFKNIFMP